VKTTSHPSHITTGASAQTREAEEPEVGRRSKCKVLVSTWLMTMLIANVDCRLSESGQQA
jgi:hypothetical protein